MIIECRFRSIDVWVNGELVNQGVDCTASAGQIALQAEGAEAEHERGGPLLAMIARNTYEPAGCISYVLPWGYQLNLFHNETSEVLLAVALCLLQAAFYGWLGYRTFTRRDL